MEKKKPLGTDPLSWLKGEKEKKENTDNVVSNQEKDKDIPIGSKEGNKEHKIQEKILETSDVTEKYRKAVLGEKGSKYNDKPRLKVQKENPATAFVIVYTILILILGFVVYRDLTKRISKIDTKLEEIEKQVETGYVNYEDTRIDDIW